MVEVGTLDALFAVAVAEGLALFFPGVGSLVGFGVALASTCEGFVAGEGVTFGVELGTAARDGVASTVGVAVNAPRESPAEPTSPAGLPKAAGVLVAVTALVVVAEVV